jgi:hypothetical protein
MAMGARLDSRQLAERLKLIRIELFGVCGIPELALQLGIPPRTWGNYELGVIMPSDILLKFIELTSVDPHWLATGEGNPRSEKSHRHDLLFAIPKGMQ